MAESSTETQKGVEVPKIFTCGAEGQHEGPVVGCCYSCGLLVCKSHTFHMPFDFMLGSVDGVAPKPIVCGTCAGPIGKPGLPEEEPTTKKPKGFSFPRLRLPRLRGRGSKPSGRA
ncbi:MAG: hypothetical protein ACPGWR_05885 [Ardenticatenaceae bacterium]